MDLRRGGKMIRYDNHGEYIVFEKNNSLQSFSKCIFQLYIQTFSMYSSNPEIYRIECKLTNYIINNIYLQ